MSAHTPAGTGRPPGSSSGRSQQREHKSLGPSCCRCRGGRGASPGPRGAGRTPPCAAAAAPATAGSAAPARKRLRSTAFPSPRSLGHSAATLLFFPYTMHTNNNLIKNKRVGIQPRRQPGLKKVCLRACNSMQLFFPLHL